MVNETNENIILENMAETETELANPPTIMTLNDGGISALAEPDPEDVYDAYISTYEIGRGLLYNDSKLEYSLRDMEDAIATLQTGKADVDHIHDGYAITDHTHSEYAALSDIESLQNSLNNKADANHTHAGFASQSDLDLLESAISTKADATHTHSDYAFSSHTHDGYVSQSDFESLEDIVNTKADASHSHADYASVAHAHDEYAETNHIHSNYAETTHNHDEDYSLLTHSHTASEIGAAVSGHNHDSDYADINHNHDSAYALVGHNHDEDYSTIDHTHTDYATVTSLNELSTVVFSKAESSHTHNDIYYTETEIDTKLAAKADSTHTHTDVYDASGAAASALTSANAYTDSKIDALVGEGASITLDTIGEISAAIEDNQDTIDLLNSAIANKANATDLTSHTGDTTIHITVTERTAWNAKSDFSGNYNDLTNKPSIPSIDGLATETYVNTQIDAIEIPSALSDLTADTTHRLVTDAEKAAWNAKSDFSGSYNDLTDKPSIPSISGLATETYVDEAVSTKADNGHSHGDLYYTETEIDSLLSGKANSTHNHNSSYDALGTAETKANAVQANVDTVSENLAEHINNADIHFTAAERTKLSGIATGANAYTHPNSGVTAGTYKSVTVNAQGHITAGTNPTTLAGYGITDAESKGAANTALVSAKEYTDEVITDEIANRNSAIATAKNSAISTASSDATTKADNALASAKTYTDSAVATVKNDLLNNAGSAYDTLKELGDLIDDNTDAIEALEAVAAGKANASHTHTIANITNLQSVLDGKAASSHGTHVTYSTTAPVMDGTASVGTATTVARSDHRHPIDTSRAAQTSLDSHTSNKSNPHGVTLAQLGITATAAELNALDGITATVTELNFVDGVTSNIQTQLNGKAASSHTHSAATTSAAGLMSASDKAKLDGITASADTVAFAQSLTSGTKVGTITINGTATSLYAPTNTDTVYTHPTYTARTGVPTANQTPAFGSTFTVSQPVSDGTGHITAVNSRTITIPSTVATISANGLMSSTDKSKLDGMVLATVSEVETYLAI